MPEVAEAHENHGQPGRVGCSDCVGVAQNPARPLEDSVINGRTSATTIIAGRPVNQTKEEEVI